MNDELSKALDGAMADAAEMGELTYTQAFESGNMYACNLKARGVWQGLIHGETPDDALRRARQIVESVNGRAAMAKRIAALEAALGTLADEYCTAEYDGGGDMAEVPIELMHNAIKVLNNQTLSAKGGA